MASPDHWKAQQVIDLQNRIMELHGKGQLSALTKAEIALLSYALGFYTAALLDKGTPEEALASLATMQRAAKKAGSS